MEALKYGLMWSLCHYQLTQCANTHQHGNVAFHIVVLSGSEPGASECLIGKSSRKSNEKNVIVRLSSNSKKQEEHIK
jgi:hypothetical protein